MASHLDLEEQEQLDQIKHFWATWGTLITAVLTVAMVALAGWNGYQYWQARQAAQAGGLYDAVEASAAAKDFDRLNQAFADMKQKYGSSAQAFQAGLLTAKVNEEAGKLDAAKEALTWLVGTTSSGEQTIARLRLASVLVAQGALEDALKAVSVDMPVEFTAVTADRKGDILALMGKNTEAIAQYKIALSTFEPGLDYKRLVEVKLNALGAPTEVAALDDAKGQVK